jgi:polysaccharide biosynthesis protein PslH
MNVVIVGAALPIPADSGSRIRTLNLVIRLAKRHKVTFLAIRDADRPETGAAVEFLRDHGVEPVEVDHVVPPKSGPRFHARLAANLVSRLPYSVARYHGPALSAAARRIAARERVDLWHTEWTAGVLALRGISGAPKVVSSHNIDTLIWERYADAEPNPPRRWFMREQARKYARFERGAFGEATRVVTVTRDDAQLACARFGCAPDRVDVVDNGVDCSYFGGVTPDREPSRILFLGSLDWRPNLDALGLMLDKIFPEVRAAVPSACLDIVGRHPPDALIRRVAETEGARLHADVPDVRPFLARAGVLAVPLRIGGGSRLKILEALATGLPVVSSRVGAEGLDLLPGVHCDIVDQAEALAGPLSAAIQQPARVQAAAKIARSHVLERYDWDALADLMDQSWQRACSGEESRRKHA